MDHAQQHAPQSGRSRYKRMNSTVAISVALSTPGRAQWYVKKFSEAFCNRRNSFDHAFGWFVCEHALIALFASTIENGWSSKKSSD